MPPPPPRPSHPKSPVRPQVQDESVPQELLTPSIPATPPPASVLTPREQMQRAEEALIQLREKMAQIAAEFAQGKLNRAQFDAIYARYSEQRLITERLLARNPESQAWQSVIRAGHTNFLKLHYESHVISYTIYDQDNFALIHHTGEIQLEHTQLLAVLQRLKSILRERGNPGPANKNLSDGRCVLFVPGKISVAVVIFSVEPSAAQVLRVQDIHHDFERANQHALSQHDYNAERMVFPHRALFEEKKY
ncbi:MAG TPA: hypothetical protein VHP83_10010 [Aggregatilineaceae bacterium]|nr:hypothetical protein [Aggregatilineaceae bacterium]